LDDIESARLQKTLAWSEDERVLVIFMSEPVGRFVPEARSYGFDELGKGKGAAALSIG
jgi:hypothetical protein